MSKMSKIRLITKFRFFLIFIVLFFNVNYASGNNSANLIWIDDIPIFSDAIINQKDAIEFDSSDGKIIIINVQSNKILLSKIFEFYNRFFKEKNWNNIEKNKYWEKSFSKLTKKSFLIDHDNSSVVTLKIITQNF